MSAAPRRTVWITGATSGIGESVARACHQRGDRLILSARTLERLEATRQELNVRDALLAPFDLAHTEGIEALAGNVV